jgi:hypothetical protein
LSGGEREKRLWHPFALMFAGIATVGGLWFGAGYCFGYGADHPTPAAIAAGLVGVGILLAIGGIVAGVLFIAAMAETFPEH